MILYTVQVDIAPTLALLFGVPIPKNNVGVLISEAFDLLTGQFSLSLSVSFVYACSGT
jgi:ethanolaminephosphotransferase